MRSDNVETVTMNLAMMELSTNRNLDLGLAPPTGHENLEVVSNAAVSSAVGVIETCMNKRRRRTYADPVGVFLAMMREDTCYTAGRLVPNVAPPPLSPPPMVLSGETPDPTGTSLSCPICLDPFTEETATRCGHIFCRDCIMGALAVKSVCPTCRKRVTKRGLIRVFLPSANNP